jgi:flagella basal body P-ring formation protein FlgA
MMRILLLVAVPLALLAPHALAQSAPVLKPVVSVSGDIVTLGDLIAGAGDKAEIAIFRAPDLGTTGLVPADTIVDAAAAHGLTGIETSGLSKISVSRAARTVSAEEITAPLAEALALSANLDGPEALAIEIDPAFASIQIPVEADGAVRIVDAFWLKEQGRFEASLIVRRIDGVDERRPLAGKAVETVEVVTTARHLDRGTIIGANDIRIDRKPKTAARDTLVIDASLVTGMEVRRTVREGQALRMSDLSEPTLVKSGTSVSMVLKSGTLTLTATGQAMSDGKIGGAVQVMNAQSKRVLQGIVTGPDQVTVQPPRTLVSAAK